MFSLLSLPAVAQSPGQDGISRQADCQSEELWISNGERSIYGVISKPRYTGKKQPVAIVSHGFNGTHHSGRSYFETLNALGYQVYAFDFPCGSVHSRSDNDTMNMSVLDEKSDLKAIVSYFLDLRHINIFKTIKKYKGPVLIVQGDQDAVVRMEDAQRAAKTYKNARLHVIPGAGHGFKPEEQAQNLREIKAFL